MIIYQLDVVELLFVTLAFDYGFSNIGWSVYVVYAHVLKSIYWVIAFPTIYALWWR